MIYILLIINIKYYKYNSIKHNSSRQIMLNTVVYDPISICLTARVVIVSVKNVIFISAKTKKVWCSFRQIYFYLHYWDGVWAPIVYLHCYRSGITRLNNNYWVQFKKNTWKLLTRLVIIFNIVTNNQKSCVIKSEKTKVS